MIREDHEMIRDDQLRIGITIWIRRIRTRIRIRIRRIKGMCRSVDRVGGWITLADLGK